MTSPEMAPFLSRAQRQALVALARAAVEAQVTGATPPDSPEIALPDASGVFVTVKSHDQLRGCLGTLACPPGHLADDVRRCAADAASRDSRFDPVSPQELPGLGIEVSVLGPLESIDPHTPGAVVVGQHGLVVEQGHRRGLLLPQVATEWGWTAAQFLRQTCVKAGLPPDAWERGARVSRFSADVFGGE
ncbi:MAG: AmmeMemoRadiSam system protein A [Vicinamibacterales bacterium]